MASFWMFCHVRDILQVSFEILSAVTEMAYWDGFPGQNQEAVPEALCKST